MTDRLRLVFSLSSVLFLIVLAVSPVKNAFREYHAYQHDFRRLAADHAPTARAAKAIASRPDRIEQIWIPQFGNRVDRCITCHQGVSEPSMTSLPLPYSAHITTAHTPADFDRFGCVFCHGGQGLATSAKEAHGKSRHWPSPLLPAAFVEAPCGRCHYDTNVPEAPRLSKGRHLMERYGCYACHPVRGYEAFAADAPSLATTSMKLRPSWVRSWLRDPRAIDSNARMPLFRIDPAEGDALIGFLFSLRPSDALVAAVEQASAEPPGDAGNGEVLFRESRCISCHTVEGKGNDSAPELSKVGSKAARGWLLQFLKDPQSFNPSTRMPAYGFSAGEVRDIVAYLTEELRDFDEPASQEPPLHPSERLVEQGRRVFIKLGCFGCHQVEGLGQQEKIAPELTAIADKKVSSLDFGRRDDLPRTLAAWLEAKLTAPSSFAPGLKMPTFSFDQDDTAAIVTNLLSLTAEVVAPEYQPAQSTSAGLPSPPAGEVGRLISHYRCLTCHIIGASGGDISTAPLTFEGSKVKRDWLARYLMVPYTLRGILPERMPYFRMSQEEAERIAAYMSDVFLDDRIRADAFDGKPPTTDEVAIGERLYYRIGCNSCHMIGTTGGYVGPPLSEAGDRLKSGWVAYWLENPQRWRKDVLCPNYGLDREQIQSLTAFISTRQKTAGPAGPAARSEGAP